MLNNFAEYVEYIADRRLERIDLPKVYGTQKSIPMDVTID